MLQSISFSIDRAPFELLETLSRHADDIRTGLDDPALTLGSVVLATCNRFEVYAETGQAGPDELLSRVAAVAGIGADALEPAAAHASEHDTASHLFAVAAGLQSAVVGESEIAGQVRRAHDEARARGTLTHDLEHLFRTATRTSREVGHRTEIRSAGKSLVRLALRMAEARIEDWGTARVLLIGTGAYAGATVAALRARGARDIRVYSPSGRAATYAAEHELEVAQQGTLAAAIAGADLVIACTRAEEPILTPELLRDAVSGSATSTPRDHTRLLIDLGMPRNIDPAVAQLPGIELLDLETVSKHAPVAELSAAAEAAEIVHEAAAEFSASRAEREALPALLALRTHVFSILEDELCRAREASASASRPGAAACSTSPATSCPVAALGADSTAAFEAALRRFTGKLLHTPMTRIRSLGREGRVPDAAIALETLFGISPSGER